MVGIFSNKNRCILRRSPRDFCPHYSSQKLLVWKIRSFKFPFASIRTKKESEYFPTVLYVSLFLKAKYSRRFNRKLFFYSVKILQWFFKKLPCCMSLLSETFKEDPGIFHVSKCKMQIIPGKVNYGFQLLSTEIENPWFQLLIRLTRSVHIYFYRYCHFIFHFTECAGRSADFRCFVFCGRIEKILNTLGDKFVFFVFFFAIPLSYCFLYVGNGRYRRQSYCTSFLVFFPNYQIIPLGLWISVSGKIVFWWPKQLLFL